jgi:hypothetical protein
LASQEDVETRFSSLYGHRRPDPLFPVQPTLAPFHSLDLMYGWREVPAQSQRVPHFHTNLLPEARKVSTTRALMSAYLSYLYRSSEKRVCGPIITCESRRGEKMFERYGFKVLNRAEITKYKAIYPESVYLSTVIKNLETADRLSAYSRARE